MHGVPLFVEFHVDSHPSSLPVVFVASGSEAIIEVVASVLQIMPKLQGLCGEPISPYVHGAS